MNNDFNDWFHFLESYSLRSERFYKDISTPDLVQRSKIACGWLQEAFDQGVIAGQKRIVEEGY